MIKDETSSLASHAEEIPGQKGAGFFEEPLADSTDGLEEKELDRQQAKERVNSWLNTASLVEELGSKKERRKLIKTKILSKIYLEPPPGHPELNVKPPSHGMSDSLERSVKEETSTDGHLQEQTHQSSQVSGPNKRFQSAVHGVEGLGHWLHNPTKIENQNAEFGTCHSIFLCCCPEFEFCWVVCYTNC